MNTKPEFHGSDLEKIEEYYGIPKESIVGFGANVNPLGLSEKVKAELAANLDIISSYPDREYTTLRRTIGEYCGVSPEHILVGNGSTELISLLIGQRSPKRTLILGPTYSEYARELSFTNSTEEYYHLQANKNFQLDVDDLIAVLKHGSDCVELSKETDCEKSEEHTGCRNPYDLLILCNPNNPTSSAINNTDLRTILTACRETRTFVMIDETYVEFAPDISTITAMPLVEEFDNLMVLRGVSKFFAAPGLRFGYGVTSNEAFLAHIKKFQIPWALNSVGAFAGERMFKDSDYISRTRKLILSERERILEELKKTDGITAFNAIANFILVQIHKEGVTSFDVFEACIRKGMMIRDCSSFQCLEGEFVRFCIMNPEDNDRLLKTLAESLN